MPDSGELEALRRKHEQNQQRRLEAVKRWVEYIQEQPPDVWGEQLNTLVDAQLRSAQETGLGVEHFQRVRGAGRERRDERPDG